MMDEQAHDGDGPGGRQLYGHPCQARFNMCSSCGGAESAHLSRLRGRRGRLQRRASRNICRRVHHAGERDSRRELPCGAGGRMVVGDAMLYSHPFDDIYRAMYWGDLSIKAKRRHRMRCR